MEVEKLSQIVLVWILSNLFHFWSKSKMQFCRNVYILDTKLICTAFSSPNINCDGWIWSRIIRSILQSWLQFRSHVSSRSLTGKAITGHYRMEARKRKDTQSKFNFRTKVYTDRLSVWRSRDFRKKHSHTSISALCEGLLLKLFCNLFFYVVDKFVSRRLLDIGCSTK